MKSVALCCCFVMAISLLPWAARGDRGSIPFDRRAQIFEPAQNAVIAWNGDHELLYLATDLRASRPTKVLEVLPLPSKPAITRSSLGVIRRAAITWRRLLGRRLVRKKRNGDSARRGNGGPAGKVSFSKKIGAHDITVTRVLRARGFVRWAKRYLRSKGAGTPHIPRRLQQVIKEYISDGYRWFAFDVVQLGRSLRTNDVLLYRFRSKRIYYPMRITRTEQGRTEVHLYVIARRYPQHFIGHSRYVRHARLTSSRQRYIDPKIAQLFSGEGARFFRWRISGRLDSFRHDVIAW